MNVAILIISSASLACSAGTLYIMARTARELQNVKTQVDTEIAKVTQKVHHNASVVRTALQALEL